MKKFMKVCAITALILLVVGLIMAIVAGSVEGANNINEIVESVTDGRVHLNLGNTGNNSNGWGIFVGDDDWDDSEALYDIDENMMFDENYEVLHGNVEKYAVGSGVKKLDIEAGGCAFDFQPSEDNNFYIEATGDSKIQCFVKNETLYIKASHTVKNWDVSNEFEMTLYIPADYQFEQVDVELGAGLLEIKDIAAKKMELEVGAGQITVDYLATDDCDVQVGMGEILIHDMQVTKMDAEVGMGHLLMDGTILGNVDAECSMGAMELNLNGKEEDFNYTLEAAMGNVTIGGTDYSGLAHEKTVKNSADKSMNINCAMGNIEVRFAE